MVGSALPNIAWIGLDPQIIRWHSRARNIAAMKMSQFVDKVIWVTFGFFPELSEGEISAGNPYFMIYLVNNDAFPCFSRRFPLKILSESFLRYRQRQRFSHIIGPARSSLQDMALKMWDLEIPGIAVFFGGISQGHSDTGRLVVTRWSSNWSSIQEMSDVVRWTRFESLPLWTQWMNDARNPPQSGAPVR